MKLIDRAVLVLALGALLTGAPGCMEDIALFPRPTLPEGQPDVIGSVERIDLAGHRLYLRPDRGERRVVTFSRDAQVLYLGREYPMTRLAPGDVVAMQIKQDARGESFVDLVRIQEELVPNNRIRGESTTAPRLESLAGIVRSIDRQDNSFGLDTPNQIVSVALSNDVRDSDRERFRTLRSGDHVRIEGKFVGRDRFEMLSFLNNEY